MVQICQHARETAKGEELFCCPWYGRVKCSSSIDDVLADGHSTNWDAPYGWWTVSCCIM